MAENKRVGPCHIFLGDPAQASGAGMTYMGETRGDVSVNPGINIVMGRTDQKGRTPLADSIYSIGPTPIVSVPFIDEEKAKLQQMLANSVLVSDSGNTALGLGSGFKAVAIADIHTLACIPIDEIAVGTNGIDAPNSIWLPAVVVVDPGQLKFNLPEGDDIFNPHETQFTGLYREVDLDGTPNAIPESMRVIFFGPPSADSVLAAQWSLPVVP